MRFNIFFKRNIFLKPHASIFLRQYFIIFSKCKAGVPAVSCYPASPPMGMGQFKLSIKQTHNCGFPTFHRPCKGGDPSWPELGPGRVQGAVPLAPVSWCCRAARGFEPSHHHSQRRRPEPSPLLALLRPGPVAGLQWPQHQQYLLFLNCPVDSKTASFLNLFFLPEPDFPGSVPCHSAPAPRETVGKFWV